jgi:hypothetical protein
MPLQSAAVWQESPPAAGLEAVEAEDVLGAVGVAGAAEVGAAADDAGDAAGVSLPPQAQKRRTRPSPSEIVRFMA